MHHYLVLYPGATSRSLLRTPKCCHGKCFLKKHGAHRRAFLSRESVIFKKRGTDRGAFLSREGRKNRKRGNHPAAWELFVTRGRGKSCFSGFRDQLADFLLSRKQGLQFWMQLKCQMGPFEYILQNGSVLGGLHLNLKPYSINAGEKRRYANAFR